MHLPDFSVTQIKTRVYLAGIKSSKNLSANITHVLSLLSEKPDLHPHESKRKHLYICAADNENQDLLSYFGVCYDFIHNALNENSTNEILIHCRAGRSRSATIAMMFLMRTYRWNYDQANQYLTKKRPIIKINKGRNTVTRSSRRMSEIYRMKIHV